MAAARDARWLDAFILSFTWGSSPISQVDDRHRIRSGRGGAVEGVIIPFCPGYGVSCCWDRLGRPECIDLYLGVVSSMLGGLDWVNMLG